MSTALVVSGIAFDKFLNYFGLACRTHRNVGNSCLTPAELAQKVSQEFWRLNQVRTQEQFLLGTTVARDRVAWADKLAKFYHQHCKVRMVTMGKELVGGYVVLSGELLAFHCTQRGKGRWLLDSAVHEGANCLDHFDVPVLNKLFEDRGFREVLREPHIRKGPDVVWRRLHT